MMAMKKNNKVSSIGISFPVLVNVGITNPIWTHSSVSSAASYTTDTYLNYTPCLRFECEIPDFELQDKIFQITIPSDNDNPLQHWVDSYYINTDKILTHSHIETNNCGYKELIRECVNYDGLMDMHYIDDDNHKTEYHARFLQGIMVALRKVNNGEENNSD